MDKQNEQSASGTGQSQTMKGGGPITGDTEVEIKAKETEKQDLAALESLVAKAQKARDIQTKIDEATSKADQKKKISKKPLPVTTSKYMYNCVHKDYSWDGSPFCKVLCEQRECEKIHNEEKMVKMCLSWRVCADISFS